MRRRSDPEAKLRQLDELASAPEEQSRYALELLQTERSLRVVQAAIEVFVGRPEPAARTPLLRLYNHYDADWLRRDAGGLLRAGILRALRPIATRADLPLLERAATTYEFMPPGRSECAEAIRAAAVVTMNEVDDELASYHCTRLLAEARLQSVGDEVTRPQSGEPAATAIRVLASQGHLLPLYSYALQPQGSYSEVLAEALRNLTALPRPLLPPLVERYRHTDNEVVLVGLFDLILGHSAAADFGDAILEFLRTTHHLDVYRYVVATAVAGRDPGLLDPILELARQEQSPRKVAILVELLTLRAADPRVRRALDELQAQR